VNSHFGHSRARSSACSSTGALLHCCFPFNLSTTMQGAIALLPPLMLCRLNPSPNAVRSRNTSKSTLAHDAVAAAVSHQRHPRWCRPHPVGLWVALALGHEAHPSKNSIFAMVFAGPTLVFWERVELDNSKRRSAGGEANEMYRKVSKFQWIISGKSSKHCRCAREIASFRNR